VDRGEDGDLMKCNVVSLGDLGRKDIRHEHFFDGFEFPCELVSGDRDLEGLADLVSGDPDLAGLD
jgi:hypothetical protein